TRSSRRLPASAAAGTSARATPRRSTASPTRSIVSSACRADAHVRAIHRAVSLALGAGAAGPGLRDAALRLARTAARMMSFDYLWLLPAAVVLPIAIVLLLMRADRQRRARLARLGELEIVRRLVPPSGMRSM